MIQLNPPPAKWPPHKNVSLLEFLRNCKKNSLHPVSLDESSDKKRAGEPYAIDLYKKYVLVICTKRVDSIPYKLCTPDELF